MSDLLTFYDYNDEILTELGERLLKQPKDCGYTKSLFCQRLLYVIQQNKQQNGV